MDNTLPDKLFDFEKGEVLLVDKPLTWTSFDVVNKIRHLLRRNLGLKGLKVGHAGTLDPMATGLLVVCTGKATKTIDSLVGLDKEYKGTMFLGAVTPSYDTETEVTETFDTSSVSENRIREAALHFLGEIEQIPPAFSAIMVNGTRAYRLARKDHDVQLKARNVTIHEFEVDASRFPEIDFRVLCSKGTYIRSLVHDFGNYLHNGAYLKSLVRTAIGDMRIEDALSLEQFENIIIGMKQI